MIKKVAKVISVHAYIVEKDSIVIRYSISFQDGTIVEDEILVQYNQPLNIAFSISLIENYFGIFLSQLFLSTGAIDLVCSGRELPFFQKVADLLYNVRNYEEGTDYYPKPFNFSNLPVEQQRKENDSVVMNLISGGKDSLASDFLLQENGATVHRCFIAGLNVTVGEKEKIACERLYRHFDTIVLHGLDRLVKLLIQISDCYGQPPQKNYIPKGRDILTIALIYPLAVQRRCSFISHSCEKDLWENNVIVDKKAIPLHDSQSRLVVESMSKQLELSTGIGLFSPICGMHEIYILAWLIKTNPSKVGLIQSCFYDSWCGKCSKCLRYYLAEKSFGSSLINFQVDPSQMIDVIRTRLKSVNAAIEVPYYKGLSYLLGDNQYCNELFTPVPSTLFPMFFSKWMLE